MTILIMLLIVIISEHRHGDGSNRNCGVSHVLTFMYTIVKMKMAMSSGAHVEKLDILAKRTHLHQSLGL